MKQKEPNGQGFTLVEIMIVVVIIGLLASMAMQTYKQIRLRSLSTTLTNDLRVYSAAFQTVNLELGYWPEDTAPGVIPPELTNNLLGFDEPTPLQGNWDWQYDTGDFTAGVAIVSSNITETIALAVDEKMDDGDLSTGRFRTTDSGYVLVLEE